MASAIRPLSYQQFEKFLTYVGCQFVHQRGSHRKWRRADLKRPIIFPADELPVFIIQNNLRLLGISHQQYLAILEKL